MQSNVETFISQFSLHDINVLYWGKWKAWFYHIPFYWSFVSYLLDVTPHTYTHGGCHTYLAFVQIWLCTSAQDELLKNTMGAVISYLSSGSTATVTTTNMAKSIKEQLIKHGGMHLMASTTICVVPVHCWSQLLPSLFVEIVTLFDYFLGPSHYPLQWMWCVCNNTYIATSHESVYAS